MNQPTTQSPVTSLKAGFTRLAFAAVVLTSLSACVTQYDTQTHYLYPPKPKATPAPKHMPKPVVNVAPTPKTTPVPKATPKPVAKTHVAPKPAATPAPAPAATSSPTPKQVITLTPFLPDDLGPAAAPGERTKPASKPAPIAATNPAGTHIGDFVIQYKAGVITKVITKKKTGVRDLDRKSVSWIWAKFQVRKGATGESAITLVWHDGSDRPTPHFY
jgi:hypothetical protein